MNDTFYSRVWNDNNNKLKCFYILYKSLSSVIMEHSRRLLEREPKEMENENKEETENAKNREYIYSYPDGNVYMGHMCDNPNYTGNNKEECFSHLRHGRGTLRTPAFVDGMPLKNYTSDEAVENAKFAKWYEYAGTWEKDKLHGYGVHVQKTGDGGEIVIFEGVWENGIPKKSVYTNTSSSSSSSSGDDDE